MVRTTNAAFERLESRQLFSAAMAANLLHREAILPAAQHVVHATPTAGGTGISAEYFADAALTTGVMTRTDGLISFKGATGTGAALKSVAGARWTGSIAVTASNSYTFTVQGSGGVKLWVNGVQLIDAAAITGGAVRASAAIALTAGTKYAFTMEYTKRPGTAANVKLLWAAAKAKQAVVPQTSYFPATTPPALSATSAGLIGRYFIGTDFKNLAFTRVDPTINFNFGSKSPDSSIPNHTPFSILWTGQITPTVSQNYEFTTTSDDGVRVYVGDQMVIDNFVQQSSHTAKGDIALTAGTAYDLKVEYFQNGVGVGDIKVGFGVPGAKSTPILASTLISSTPPASAGTLTAVAAAADEVDLSWTGSPAATGYTVAQSVDGGMTWANVAATGPGITAFNETGLTANSGYAFKVTPFGSADTSTPSNVVTVTTLTPPPASVSATAASPTEVDLAWADVAGETGFNILESVNGGPYALLGTVPTGTTSLPVTGLAPGVGYGFEVESLNATGAPSVPAVTSGAAATPTAAPAGLVALGTSTSTASLAWADVVGDGGFEVERSTDGATWTVAGTTAADVTTFTDTGLAPGVTYSYRIRGLSAADLTVVSAPSAVASTPTVPAAPTAVNATAFSSTLVNLTWADVTGEAGFNVFESIDGGTTYLPAGHVTAGVTSFGVTPLLPATAYQFAVQAVNSAGQGSALSANHTASGTTTLALAPTALVAIGTSATAATLTWTPSVGATGYLIERSTDGTTWTAVATPAASAVAYVDTTLSAGTSYSYRIRATDAGGASDPSAVSVALTAPSVVTAALTGLNVATSSVSFPAVPGATSYAVQRSLDGLTGWTTVSTVNGSGTATPSSMVASPATSVPAGTTLSATVPNLAPSTVYYYRVIASNATGSSAPSAVVSQMSAPLATYAQENQLYGLASGLTATAAGTVYAVNMTAGTTTLIGQMLPGAYAANRDPLTGTISYAVGSTTNSPSIYNWDPKTGNNTFVVSPTYAAPVAKAAYDSSGTAWIVDTASNLYTFARNGTAPVKVGTLKLAGTTLANAAGNMVFSPTGTLSVAEGGAIYTVNTTTAVATPSSALGLGNVNIVYGNSGTLYSTDSQGHIYSLSSVLATLIPSSGVPVFNSLTATPTFVDLTVAATSTPTVFHAGTATAYSVNVSNTGANGTSAGSISVSVTLGAGLTYASVTGTGWTATSTTGLTGTTVVMTYAGMVAVNGNAPTATLNVNVTSSAAITAVTTFTVNTTQFDTGILNNTATVTNAVS